MTGLNINLLFGLKIKQLRIEKSMTQEQLGYETGLHRSYIGQVERGEKNISLKNIEKIAREFEISVSELLDFSTLENHR